MPARKKVDRTEFAHLHARGLTQQELAIRFGIARSSVIRLSNELRLNRRPHTATAEQLDLWKTLLDEGWSYAEIAKTHHVSTDTLRRYFPGRAWDEKQRAEMIGVWRDFNSPTLTKNYAHPRRRAA